MINRKLKPLILCCWPDEACEPALSELPAAFEQPHIAVSQSAQEHGWLRVLAANYRVFSSVDQKQLILRLNSYDLLIVYPLSLNSLAKFSLGIRDSFPAEVFWQFTRLGKPVLIARQFVPGDDSAMNPHLLKTYRRHFEALTGGTIAAFDADNLELKAAAILRAQAALKNATSTTGRGVITRDDIIIAAQSLEPLKVEPGCIITDLAREEAEKLGVTIVTN